jgi:uncharacterized protein
MPEMKKEQRLLELRAVQTEPDSKEMIVEGRAVVFNSPTVIWEYDGIKYYEVVDSKALDGCDMSDVVFRYNHSQDVMIMARTRKGSLQLIKDDIGLNIKATLFDIAPARDLYTLIKEGAIDQMSFSFVVAEDSYNQDTRTRTILKFKKLYDVAAVDMGAYSDTTISARSFFELEREKERKVLESAELRKKELGLKVKLLNLGGNH